MQQGNSIKLLSWVKIRIGEPLTAVEIDKCTFLYKIQKKESVSVPFQDMWDTMILIRKKLPTLRQLTINLFEEYLY